MLKLYIGAPIGQRTGGQFDIRRRYTPDAGQVGGGQVRDGYGAEIAVDHRRARLGF
jgi:hypothetical protein